MKIKLLIISAILPAVLTACPFGEFTEVNTRIVAPRTTIRVGESIVLMIDREVRQLSGSGSIYGFIYSGGDINDGPYLDDGHGQIDPKGRPELYPVAPIIEIISTPAPTNNVPPLALAQYDGRQARTEFTIRGKQPGIAVIKAGFVRNIDGIGYSRMSHWVNRDGMIQITVVE